MKIIFIIVDALRWDYLTHNGYSRPTTPNLDRIAKDSLVFNHAYATINQTDQSLTSIFSGTYPLTHGLERHAAFLTPERLESLNAWNLVYLPQILSQANYSTIGIDWLHRWHQWGFDWYQGRDDQAGRTRARRAAQRFPAAAAAAARFLRMLGGSWTALGTKPGVNAARATKIALEALESEPQDTFLLVHYWDAHLPYLPPYEYLNEMSTISLPGEQRDIRTIVNGLCKSEEYKEWAKKYVVRDAKTTGDLIRQYCSAVRSIDEQIGKIYRHLEDKGMLDETVLVITSDHGENLFEDGYFIEHSGVRERVIHVPLIVKLPHYSAAVIDQVVSHVDIVPTLADYLDLPHAQEFDGDSLIPLLASDDSAKSRAIYFQSRLEEGRWGIIDGRCKYVEDRHLQDHTCPYCENKHHPTAELYDLSDDYAEATDLVAALPNKARSMQMQLKDFGDHLIERKNQWGTAGHPEAGMKRYDQDEKTWMERRLKSLGYLD